MSVTSGFFNSVNHDRRYNAAQMSAIFDGIINDGVFANIGSAFAVTADTGVTVNIAKGRAWFNSAWIYNDAPLPKTLEGSEVVLDRIDAIVIEVDHNENVRFGDIKIVKGTPSSSPKRPAMANEENKHQHPLAYIYRKAGSTKITQADITSMIGTSSCPYITGILQVQNIDNIVAQWEGQWNQWYATKIVETNTDSSELIAEMKSEFDRWFSDLKAVLADDVATNLASQVADLMGKFDTLASEGCVYDEIEDSDFEPIIGSDGTPIQGKTVFSSDDDDAMPKTMVDDLDMNGNRILNVADPEADTDGANAGYVRRVTAQASSPCNLLDNSDFTNPVNQRASTSYPESSGYTIDRWKNTTGLTVSVADGMIVLKNTKGEGFQGTTDSFGFYQIVEDGKIIAGKKYTLAVKTAGGDIYAASVTAPVPGSDFTIVYTDAIVVDSIAHMRMGVSSDGLYQFRLSVELGKTLELEWAALYDGEYTVDAFPAYQPKGYGAELAECQRYYSRLGTVGAPGYVYSAGTVYFMYNTPVVMRVKPTIISTDAEFTIRVNGMKGTIGILSDTYYYTGNQLRLRADVSDAPVDCAIFVMKSAGIFELSADL